MSVEQAGLSKEFRFTGWHMLACMLAFFGVIIAVNLTMATMASRSWTGLIVKNSYVASQQFNSDLAEAEAQRKRGWKSELAFSAKKLSFVLRDDQGSPLVPETLKIVVGRPAFEQMDRTVVVKPNATGRFETEIELKEGVWSLRIEAAVNGQSYRRDARLVVSPSGQGVFE